jgi:hypothetical protein
MARKSYQTAAWKGGRKPLAGFPGDLVIRDVAFREDPTPGRLGNRLGAVTTGVWDRKARIKVDAALFQCPVMHAR